jgi:hypothetical protein
MIILVVVIALKQVLHRVPSQEKLVFLDSFCVLPVIVVHMV